MSITKKIHLTKSVHPQLYNELEDRLKYCFKHLEDITFLNEKVIEITFGKDEKNIESTINAITESLSQVDIEFRKRILYSNNGNYTPSDCIKEAFKKGFIKEISPGIYSLTGFLYNLKKYIDEKFLEICKNFGATEIELPSIVSSINLMRAGHFSFFPHHIYLVSNIDFKKNQSNTLSDINTDKDLYDKLNAITEHARICLTPSVCYNYYKLLEDTSIEKPEDTIVTAKARCFRFELSNIGALRRQKEFDMREVIFFGAADEVSNLRKIILESIWEFVLEHDFKAEVVNSFDPFFLDNLAARSAIQCNREMKYELNINYDDSQSIAVSSFNLHSSTFSKAFNIKNKENKIINSGCIGFGLERWVLAFISKYSLDKSKWPNDLYYLF